MVEHATENRSVGGSIPPLGTILFIPDRLGRLLKEPLRLPRITPKKLADRLAAVERKISEQHLRAMDEADRQEEAEPADRVDVAKALEALEAQRATIGQQARELTQQGLKQRVASEREREARLMRTAREGRQVACNVQIAVDGEHKLIAGFDLTNECNDERQLLPVAQQAKQALGVETTLTVVADTGYSNGEQASQCAEAGITPIAPRPATEQFFTRDAFAYDATADAYRRPAGQTLTCGRVSRTEQKKEYWTKACPDCPSRRSAPRRPDVRSCEATTKTPVRRCTSAPPPTRNGCGCGAAFARRPFGTMKWMMGHPRFLVRGQKAGSEWALEVLGYNIKRTIQILGPNRLIEALKACPA